MDLSSASPSGSLFWELPDCSSAPSPAAGPAENASRLYIRAVVRSTVRDAAVAARDNVLVSLYDAMVTFQTSRGNSHGSMFAAAVCRGSSQRLLHSAPLPGRSHV